LTFSRWLSDLYAFPRGFLIAIGAANVAYGLYSFSLAIRLRRTRALIVFLVLANATWSVVCWVAVFIMMNSVSIYGIAHLVLEGTFVAALAGMEWKQRARLISAS
jgi:hypothetical protein